MVFLRPHDENVGTFVSIFEVALMDFTVHLPQFSLEFLPTVTRAFVMELDTGQVVDLEVLGGFLRTDGRTLS